MTTALRRSTWGRALVVAVASCSLLVACGDEGADSGADDPNASATPSPEDPEQSEEPTEPAEPTEPECASVWVAGEQLPRRYQGCFDAEKGRWQEAMVYRCGSGQQLVTYRRNFYAAKGEVVNETAGPLAKDPNFKKAMAACGA